MAEAKSSSSSSRSESPGVGSVDPLSTDSQVSEGKEITQGATSLETAVDKLLQKQRK